MKAMNNPNSQRHISPEEMNRIQPLRTPKPMTNEELIAWQTEQAWASQEPKNQKIQDDIEAAWLQHDLAEHQEQLEGKLTEAHFRAHAAKNETRELSSQRQIDILTGLANRAAFDSWLEVNITTKSRNLWVGFIDVDHFKQINDKYGHTVGDNVLGIIAKALSTNIREEEDIVAHPHGDEFLLGIAGGDELRIKEIAETILHTVNSIGVAEGGRFVPVIGRPQEGTTPLQLSIGFASWEPGMTSAELLKKADQSMYKAKQNGRNSYVIQPKTKPD